MASAGRHSAWGERYAATPEESTMALRARNVLCAGACLILTVHMASGHKASEKAGVGQPDISAALIAKKQASGGLVNVVGGGGGCPFASLTSPHPPTGTLQQLRAEERSCCNQPYPPLWSPWRQKKKEAVCFGEFGLKRRYIM